MVGFDYKWVLQFTMLNVKLGIYSRVTDNYQLKSISGNMKTKNISPRNYQ